MVGRCEACSFATKEDAVTIKVRVISSQAETFTVL